MERTQRFSDGEERANALSAGVGGLLSLLALGVMVGSPVGHQSGWHLVGGIVFGVTLVVNYLSSYLNHSLPVGPRKDFFHNFDQVAIYLLIAGTYTPMALVALRGELGFGILATEWILALGGSARKLFWPNTFEKGVDVPTIVSYVMMGCLVVLALEPLRDVISVSGMLWLGLGGFFYISGLIFFAMKKMRYHHLVWHVFVIIGSACHVVLVWRYVLPIPS